MREHVGNQDQIIRSLLGPAVIAIGIEILRRRKGRAAGISSIVLGVFLVGTAVRKMCPLNGFFPDTQRKNKRSNRSWYELQQEVFSSHRKNLLKAADKPSATPKELSNFGKNISFSPTHLYAPKNEEEVLEILNRHRNDKIRAIGSLHAWSDIVVSNGVTISLHHLNQVNLEREKNEIWASVGGGCRIQDLLDFLDREAGVTLPTVPAVTEQTIAGAISTGTHGSGMPSISHFIEEVRLAAYDEQTGEARVYEWSDGPKLRAARCGLGCTGIILSVRFKCVSRYMIEQSVSRVKTFEEVRASEEHFPLQQTILIPYVWEYFVYKRRPIHDRQLKTSWIASLFGVHWFVIIDVLFHATLIPLVNIFRNRSLIRFYLKRVAPAMLWEAPSHTGNSAEVLVLEHELFEHIEMELFIPGRHISVAAEFLQEVISLYAGETENISPQYENQLKSIGMFHELKKNHSTYFHHMPFLIRRILPDDTLISMTAGADEPYYSISVFSYYKDRTKMYPLAEFLARSMNLLYNAGLHWGKYFPLKNDEIEPLYPKLEEFREMCSIVDPNGNFRNSYTKRVLGF